MSEAENKARVLDWVDALAKSDVDRILAAYHPDLVYTVIGHWPLAGTFGRDTMAANARDVFTVFPDGLTFRAHKLVADGDWVALDMESRGQHVSGKLYNNRYTYWIQIRDGKFLRLEEHLDTQHAIEVLCTPSDAAGALDFGVRRTDDDADPRDVARRFFAAIARGDLDAVSAIYAPDVVVWHNTDRTAKTREQNLGMLAWAIENVAQLRYEEVRLEAFPGGFVQCHVVRGTEKISGRELVLPAVVVCRVAGDRITRLDEYFDSAQAPGGVPQPR